MSDHPIQLPAHTPWCLGCGDENPASLGLTFFFDGQRVRASFTVDRRHEGAPGFVHGGALATALDDSIGGLLFALKRPAVTAHLEVDYHRPALVGRTFDVEVWVREIDGRKLWLEGELRDGDDLVASTKALFIQVDREHFAGGSRVPPNWLQGGGGLPY